MMHNNRVKWKKNGMEEITINFGVDTSPKEAKKIHTPDELQIMFIELNTTTEDKDEVSLCA